MFSREVSSCQKIERGSEIQKKNGGKKRKKKKKQVITPSYTPRRESHTNPVSKKGISRTNLARKNKKKTEIKTQTSTPMPQ
jgi:hypothetical protein